MRSRPFIPRFENRSPSPESESTAGGRENPTQSETARFSWILVESLAHGQEILSRGRVYAEISGVSIPPRAGQGYFPSSASQDEAKARAEATASLPARKQSFHWLDLAS